MRKPAPKRRPPKRIRTPPDNEDKPSRPIQNTPPPTPPPFRNTPSPTAPPIHQDESMHEDEKDHTPRIYTEETVVNHFHYLFLFLPFVVLFH